LKFITTGIITIEMAQNAKGKVLTLPKQINKAMGKASNQMMGFNEVNWGVRCRSYVKSTKKLTNAQFDKIIKLATEYMTTTNHMVNDAEIIKIEDDKDARANIIDCESEVKSNCRSAPLFEVRHKHFTIYLEVMCRRPLGLNIL
jgi:hypothetical protein